MFKCDHRVCFIQHSEKVENDKANSCKKLIVNKFHSNKEMCRIQNMRWSLKSKLKLAVYWFTEKSCKS